MFKNLINNLTTGQKILIFGVIQIFVIAGIVGFAIFNLQDKDKVIVANENATPIPENEWKGVKNRLWDTIKQSLPDYGKNIIDDAVVREGSYKEDENDGVTTASFLVDIDSVKQTYDIRVAWSDKEELYESISVSCPSKDLMKYPETVCYSLNNNTYSLDLYLPHEITSWVNGSEMIEAYITGDEYNQTIDVAMVPCDIDSTRKKVDDYLASTPIVLSDYDINYYVNSSDVDCDNTIIEGEEEEDE